MIRIAVSGGLWWVIVIAGFWVPPIFLAVWLRPVKDTETMPAWILFGWLGLAIMAARKNRPHVDGERARNRSLICGFLGVTGVLAAIGLAIWQNDHRPLDVNATVTSMQRDSAAVSCVKEGWILLAGQRDDVYGCTASEDGSNRGCYAREGNADMVDVTAEARAIASAGGAKLPCRIT